jgi:hypothetical protein
VMVIISGSMGHSAPVIRGSHRLMLGIKETRSRANTMQR